MGASPFDQVSVPSSMRTLGKNSTEESHGELQPTRSGGPATLAGKSILSLTSSRVV